MCQSLSKQAKKKTKEKDKIKPEKKVGNGKKERKKSS